MKTRFLFLSRFPILLLGILMMIACSSNSDNPMEKPEHPVLLNFTHSGCKVVSTTKSNLVDHSNYLSNSVLQTDDIDKDAISLKAMPDGKLRIEHGNVTLSCEALIQIDFRVEGKTLILTEKSTDDTNCTCDYDLVLTLEGLDETAYHVIVQRQTIDRKGAATQKEVTYGDFNFTYSKDLSLTTKINRI